MKGKSNSIKNIITVFSVLVLAKLVAFIQEAVLAAYLGTSIEADAFNMVVGIQHVIYPMLSVGIWKVFLPEYKKKMTTDGVESADAMANKFLVLFGGVSAVASVLIFLCKDFIVNLCAPGMSLEGKKMCAELLGISAPLYFFIIISTVYAVMLQCHNKFFGSQIREIASHVPTIIMAIFFYGKYGITMMAYGLVLGSMCRWLIELPFINWGYRFKVVKVCFEQSEKQMLRRIPEALITAGVEQINALVDKIMASTMVVGSISALNYAHKLLNVVSGLFGKAISTVLYPQIAECVAQKDRNRIESIITQSVTVICFFLVPITVGSVFFAPTIISCVFERGAFDAEATKITTPIFQCYVLGLVFIGLKDVLSNVLYAYGDTKKTMRISMLTVTANIILNIVLSMWMGAKGLALATSIAAIIHVCASFVALNRYVNVRYHDIVKEIAKIIGTALLSCVIAYVCVEMMQPDSRYLYMIIVLMICIIIYLIILYFLKSQALLIFLKYRKKHND